MRLVLIISGLGTGGAERMLLKVLERLDRRRFEPFVISLTTEGEIGPCIRALGIPVEALGMRRCGLWHAPRAWWRLVRRLRALRPAVVHTWMYHADLLGGLAARMCGIHAIGWCIRSSNLEGSKTRLATHAVVRLCAALSRKIPARILLCSGEARRVHAALGYDSGKFTVIPNGFDLARFRPDAAAGAAVRQELGVGPATPLVGLIGRFDPLKNHRGFFQAAAILRRRMPGVHFVLAGGGIDPGNEALSAAANDAGIASAVHLLGLRNDLPRLMAALDVLASSSWGEAFPNVLGEAMACGVPCAVTDVGDSAHIVGDTGRVVAAGDMDGLAAAMEELLTLPPAERAAAGERARARVAECFEIGRVVRQYEAFYDDLAACQTGTGQPAGLSGGK